MTAIKKLRSVFGVLDADGRGYIWKTLKSPHYVPRLYEVERLTKQLREVGIQAAGPIRTLTGELICQVDSSVEKRVTGYLQPWLEGRHVNLADSVERRAVLSTICSMHRETAVLPVTYEPAMQGDVSKGTWPGSLLAMRMQQKLGLLRSYWSELCGLLPRLKSMEHELFAAARSALMAAQSGTAVDREVSPGALGQSLNYRCWCHRDLAPHNLIWDGDSVGLIDFDLAAPDDPLGDVAQVCNHALFLQAVNQSEWQTMVRHYSDCANLSGAMRGRLWRILGFPDALSRMLSEWVRSGKPASFPNLSHAVGCEETRLCWLHEGTDEQG